MTDFERASDPWHLEWVADPESLVRASGVLHQTIFEMSGLVVNESAMLDNLNSNRGPIVAEAVMIARNPAHDFVYEACKTSIKTKETLLGILLGSEWVSGMIGEHKLQNLCDPRQYLGESAAMTDGVVSH